MKGKTVGKTRKVIGRLADPRNDPPYQVSAMEALRIQRRVLRLADGYLAKQKQELLVTDGSGLMTWGDIRQHIQACLKNLKVEQQ